MFFLAAILILIFALDVTWYWAILVCLLATLKFTFEGTDSRGRRWKMRL